MCTALLYVDASGKTYTARTMELDVSEPYLLAYLPVGMPVSSHVGDADPVEFETSHAILGYAVPTVRPSAGQHIDPSALLILDGQNDAGLALNLNAYPTDGSAIEPLPEGRPAIEAKVLSTWLLGRFATVAEVKAGLEAQPVNATRLAAMGGAAWPLHVMVSDTTGASLVIEWNDGRMQVYDNPVGVMTNGPEFPWHLTNLKNWTHLDNVDHSVATFGSIAVSQPDSGIATSALPASNTSVGRFVRAVYYTSFTEKATGPDAGLHTAARIINNFDRPRGATVDLPGSAAEGVTIHGTDEHPGQPRTEYTAITSISDMSGGRFLVRTYDALNYSVADLNRLSKSDKPHLMPLSELDQMGGDFTDTLLAG